MIPFVVVVIVALALGVIVFAAKNSNRDVKSRLAAIDASAGLGQADDSANIFQRLVNQQHHDRLDVRLQEAGWYDMTPAKLFARAGTYGAAGAGVGALFVVLLHLFSMLGLVIVIAVAAFGLYKPFASLANTINRRKTNVRRALPDFLDLLSSTVEAGVALNAAISVAAEGMEGALGDELRTALSDVRLGRSRAEALTAMSTRVRETDLTTVVTALVQSERVGASITHVVAELAADSRDRRIMRAEELAAALSNKLIFPMALCMLPALFIMIFGGALARYLVPH
ncbi:MAG: type II secretion system F family protein [Candidatus Tyrphobacter sp.]